MQAISLWLAAAIVILTGWAIVKKYQVNMVLFIAGLLLNIIGVMNGATNFLPKNATATGLLGFDFFELFRAICRTQIAGVIIIVAGFAKVSPFAIIKRTAIPCVVGYITMLIIVSAIF